MKKFTGFVLLTILLLSTSCSTYDYFYQLSEVRPVQQMDSTKTSLVYEDSSCTISYNFWADGGTMTVSIHNKTDQYMTVELERCFFVKNGYAYNYFRDQSVTHTVNENDEEKAEFNPESPYRPSSYSEAKEADKHSVFKRKPQEQTAGTPIETRTARVVIIPPHLSKVVNELEGTIQQNLFHDCDLFLYPRTDAEKSVRLTFDYGHSPFTFGNRLSYRIGNGKPVEVVNDFYVASVQNYRRKDFVEVEKVRKSFCPDEDPRTKGKGDLHAYVKRNRFKHQSPSAFYLKYMKMPTDEYLH